MGDLHARAGRDGPDSRRIRDQQPALGCPRDADPARGAAAEEASHPPARAHLGGGRAALRAHPAAVRALRRSAPQRRRVDRHHAGRWNAHEGPRAPDPVRRRAPRNPSTAAQAGRAQQGDPGMIRRLLAFIAALATAGALAQGDYPGKPIKLIVPFPPAGGTDTLSRAIAQSITNDTKWTIVVENRPGAGGNIGLDAAAKP